MKLVTRDEKKISILPQTLSSIIMRFQYVLSTALNDCLIIFKYIRSNYFLHTNEQLRNSHNIQNRGSLETLSQI